MKHNKVQDQDDDELENFIVEKRRESKTQPIADHQLTKRTNSTMDGKKTVKYSQDPQINNMFEKIIRKSDKLALDDLPPSQFQLKDDLYEYQPHIITGVIKNVHKISEEERLAYGLQDENECCVCEIGENYEVVLIGKMGFVPMQGIKGNLYLPRGVYEYVNVGEGKRKDLDVPQRLVVDQGKYVILIKRQLLPSKSKNILDYPYLILDPSNLLYPSLICNWIDCKRRISIVNYVQGNKQINEHLVFGSTCHRLLQWLAEKIVTVGEYLNNKQKVLQKLYDSMLYDMYLIDKEFKAFSEHCSANLDNLVNFYQYHIVLGNKMEVNKFRRQFLRITKMVSSQEMFRSKFMGLKGKLDLLLAGEIIDEKQNTTIEVNVPLQLKTGKKTSFSHKRQTQIYNMLIREEYKKPVIGLLYYSDSNMKCFVEECPLSAYEIIVVHRNQIAQNFINIFSNSSKMTLPKFSFNQCEFCEVLPICQTIYKQIQKQEGDVVDLPSKYAKKEVKYGGKEVEYMVKWFKWIHLQEAQHKNNYKKTSQIGISSFKVQNNQLQLLLPPDKKIKFKIQIYHLCKSLQELSSFDEYYKISNKVRILIPSINFLQGCKVYQVEAEVSTKKFTLTLEMNNSQIKFSQRKLTYFNENNMEIDAEIQTFQNGFYGNMRNSVIDLISQDSFIKDLVIKSDTNKHILEIESQDEDDDVPLGFGISNAEYQGMNEDQKLAYQIAIHEQKFSLIQGMPGTGKTQLIIKLIHKFTAMKKSILVTTFTNRSLDNILERLIETDKIERDMIIREGSQYACSKTLKEFTSKSQQFETFQHYKEYYGKKRVWFVTLNSLFIHHLPKTFDIVIMDQASQCLEPVCIEGIKRAKKFIMIGDYKQLQPIVKSKEAYNEGMRISLFQRLCLKYPRNKVALKKQYRMNEEIMKLSNKLVYNNTLELANKELKEKRIKLFQFWNWQVPPAFHQIISPQNSIVFINHDPLMDAVTKKYKQKTDNIKRVIEAELPAYIFKQFINLKVSQHQMAIIASRNASINLIFNILRKQKVIEDNLGSILTIDKSQGIDKDIIILLIERGIQEFIEDPRRLNVALTRAKSKLIIIGSKYHLGEMKVWKGTLEKMLREYQIDITKEMVQSILKELPNTKE